MNNWGNQWYEVLGWALFSLRGRLNRKGYIWGFIFSFVFLAVIIVQIAVAPEQSTRQLVWAFMYIASMFLFTWWQLALAAKRLRDFNWSPWLCLLVPVTQPIAFIILAFKKSEPLDSIFSETRKPNLVENQDKFGR